MKILPAKKKSTAPKILPEKRKQGPTVEATMRHIIDMQKINTNIITKTLEKISEAGAKATEWEFTVIRNKNGYIKTVKAVAK